MARSRMRRTVSCSLLLAALVGCTSNSGIRHGAGRKIAVPANREISESSGITASGHFRARMPSHPDDHATQAA